MKFFFSFITITSLIATSFASLEDIKFHHHHLKSRDASTIMSKGESNEGEAHGKIKAPQGSKFVSIPVGDQGEEMPAFWTSDHDNSAAKQAFIMIHGKLRNGGDYWSTMNNILQSALKDNTKGADKNAIVVAPQFFSKKYNSGQYTSKQLAFGDVNAWQAGEAAIYPSGSKITSFDALDALVNEFMDITKYPQMKNVTVIGHGGGAQLNQRYAMIAKDSPRQDIHIRYIHGDPSSCAYFTANRPQSISGEPSLPKRDDCKYFNTWRYGFDNFTGTADGLLTPKDYFRQYATRDVVSIVGYQDTSANGDNYCMARMQGGTKRRDRNLAWWQYINTLARTNENLDGFPATFKELPDWSDVLNGANFNVRLSVVEDADHDPEEVFNCDEGRAALFSKDTIDGWRPEKASNRTKKSKSKKTPSKSKKNKSRSPSLPAQSRAEHDSKSPMKLIHQNSASKLPILSTFASFTIISITTTLTLSFFAR